MKTNATNQATREQQLRESIFSKDHARETAREAEHTLRICNNLRAVVKANGLSQREVATLAGVTQPCVTQWTKHGVRPGIYALARFVSFLGQLHLLNGATASQHRALQALRATILDVDP